MSARDLAATFGYLHSSEVDALQLLVKNLPPDSAVVNIGAGAGTSALAILEARDDVRLYSVDIQLESSPYGSLDGERNELAKHLGNSDWNLRYEAIHKDSKWVAERWPLSEYNPAWYRRMPKRVDMVFIDGDHTYEGCSGDIKGWLPHIKSGGVMAVHDYKKGTLGTHDGLNMSPWPGVDKAVDELLVGKYELILMAWSLAAFRMRR